MEKISLDFISSVSRSLTCRVIHSEDELVACLDQPYLLVWSVQVPVEWGFSSVRGQSSYIVN